MQFFDLVFNGQTVAVPTRHVDRVKAFELARLHDHVFENFVDRVADVDVAVGIGRAIVQHKLRLARACRTQFVMQLAIFPFFHPLGLALGQIAAHGEGGVGQIQGFAVIGGAVLCHFSRCSKRDERGRNGAPQR